MPEVALVIGQRRVNGRVVQEQHPAVGVPFVVLVDRLGQRVGHAGRVALHDVADALVDRHLKLDQRFLGADLVVEGHDFERLAIQHAAIRIHQGFGRELILAQTVAAGAGKRTRQRVDEGDLDVLGHGRPRAHSERKRGAEAELDGFAHFLPPIGTRHF